MPHPSLPFPPSLSPPPHVLTLGSELTSQIHYLYSSSSASFALGKHLRQIPKPSAAFAAFLPCFHLIPSTSFTSFPLVYIHIYLDRTNLISFPGCIPIYIFLKPSYRYLSLIRALHFHPLSIWQKLSASLWVFRSPGPGLSIVFCTFFSCYVGSPQDL